MKTSKNNVAWIIRCIIAFLFLLSAVAKLYPSPYFAISTFEVKQLYPMGFTEGIAPYFSRILIGIEFALGFLILQKHYLRKLVIPGTLLLLAVFTTHLTIESFMNGGNSGNCGCFGSLLPMTPIEAIIKNVVAMVLLGYLFFILPKRIENKDNFWFLLSVTLGCVLSLFMIAPIQPIIKKIEEPVFETSTEIDSTFFKNDVTFDPKSIDTAKTIKNDTVKTEPLLDEPAKKKSGYATYFSTIDKGRKTLCFFVPGCDHCRDAAKDLVEMQKRIKNFPEVSILFMNEEAELIPDFFKFAGKTFPYKIIEVIPFWNELGSGKDTPGIKYLWNGNEFHYFYGINENKFTAKDFESLIQKPYNELKKNK